MFARLGVGDDDRRAERGLDELAREQALGVVAEHDRVGIARRARARASTIRARSACGERRGRLPIGAHDLLVVRDDARLARRRPVVERHAARARRRRSRRTARAAAPPSASSPTRADERHLRAERAQVVRDVARAAERERVIAHRDHRYRRFGRDARDAAPDPLVEHHVADDDDAPARHAREQLARASGVASTSGMPTRSTIQCGRASSSDAAR